MSALDDARRLVAESTRVTVLTGAGISTGSGIPDFRGPNGQWTRDPRAERLSAIDEYVRDAAVRREAWQARLRSPMWSAAPNAGHSALVELDRRGALRTLVTQNVDGLHLVAGTPAERVVEVHGNAFRSRCLGCAEVLPMAEVLERVRAGDPDPACRRCGGILKSDTISFGESLVRESIEAAFAAAEDCDLLLAVGSTLSVRPVANMVPIAHRAGARIVVVNGQPTPFDEMAAAVVGGDIVEVLPQIVARPD